MRTHLREIAAARLADGAAIPAITCYGASTAVSVVAAADAAELPVVLLVPPNLAVATEGSRTIRAMRAIADAAEVPVSVQLDHATDPNVIMDALRAGVDAVLADGSKLPLAENAAFVRSVRALAGPDITVEAELGSLPGDEDRAVDVDPDAAAMTDPDTVAEFVELSTCDLLAVAVGNVHGRYRGKPLIDRDRLARIRKLSPVPLVLHGASGLPSDDLVRAGASGIAKVNINTELRGAVLEVIQAGIAGARAAGDNVLELSQARAAVTRSFTEDVLRRLAGSSRPVTSGERGR